MDSIAVFGGGGFIGSHLSRRLVEKGYELDIVDVSTEKIRDLITEDQVDFHNLDIQDEEDDERCRTITKNADTAIDLVAYANPQEYVDKPIDVVDLNYHANLKIVEDCVEFDTRLIQFSTCEVYGKLGNRSEEDLIFDEDTSDCVTGPIENHRWIYATAKELLERMVHAHGMENGLDWTIVRPFNFVGRDMDYIITSPDEGTPRVFASFMSALLYDHPMYLVDGGKNKRTFTYIDDAVSATELMIENENDHFTNEIVNIGTPGNEVTIREFAELMRELYQEMSTDGSLPDLIEVGGEEYYGEGYEDCERRVPDVEKLTSAGWEPRYDLRESLENTMPYYIRMHEDGMSDKLITKSNISGTTD